MPTLTDAEFTAQDEATLLEMFDAVPRYVNAGDWASWAGVYSEDGPLQPPNAPVIRGRSNLLAWGQAFPPIEAFTFSKVEVFGEGNLAYGMSAYTLKLRDSATDTGKQLVVFRREADGKWKVVAASYSSDLPVPGR
jgi:ketosteroid isomerase-like protein